MNNKRNIVIVIISLLLSIVLGISYAFYTYSRVGTNQKLIAGDIYMRYIETNSLNFTNAMPTDNYVENQYFEFDIVGKNTYKEKDIIYNIFLSYGDNHETRNIRIRDDLLKFRLVMVDNNEEIEIFNNQSYQSINNQKIYTARINKNTNNEVIYKYRLYAWISNEIIIGNTDSAIYSTTEWNNVYASIKVNVDGGFEFVNDDIVVTFDAHDGISSENSRQIALGDKVGELPTVTPPNILGFNGWWTEEFGGRQIDENEIINKTITFHAQYVSYYTVTYELDNPTSFDFTSKQVIPRNQVGTFPNVTKTNYILYGWYQDRDFNIPVDETFIITEDTTLYARWILSDKTAMINNDEYFNTLQDAVTEAGNRSTQVKITLLKNVIENIIIPSTANIEFDFGNYTLSSSSGNTLDNSGTISIKNGLIKRTGSNDTKHVLYNREDGVVNITGGKLYSESTQAVYNLGTINMSGGEVFVSSIVDQGVINNYNILNIFGGKITATKRQAVYNDGGVLTISETAYLENGVNAKPNRACVQNHNGTINIKGGKIVSPSTEYAAVLQENGTMTIGIDDEVIDQTTPVIQGVKYGLEIKSGKTVNYFDGIIKAKTDNQAVNNERVLIINYGITLQKGVEMIGTDSYNVVYLIK